MARDSGYRRHERRSFGYRAKVDFLDGNPPRLCMIVDISEGGARLRLREVATPPDSVKLLLTDDGATRMCQVRWRRLNEFGVQFVKR
jgi:hypothetical protein